MNSPGNVGLFTIKDYEGGNFTPIADNLEGAQSMHEPWLRMWKGRSLPKLMELKLLLPEWNQDGFPGKSGQ